MIRSTNPYNNELIAEYQEYSSEEIERRIETANRRFESWKRTTLEHRTQLLSKLAERLQQKRDEAAKMITLEMGKPISETFAEVDKCVWLCEHYAEQSQVYLEINIIETDAAYSAVHFEPLGVIMGVMPWNFPFWQAFRFFVPALMAGNVCLLKHASNVSGSALMMESLLSDAGFPEGCLQVLLVPGEKSTKLVADERIKGVSLTGSAPAGSAVAEMAGKNLKPSLLELGGSNAMIILDDADLDDAVDQAILGRFQNTGQSCIAAKRLLVEKGIYAGFREKFLQKVRQMKFGDPLDEENRIGPMARKDLAEDLHKQVHKSVEMGAQLLCGGNYNGALFEPTVVEGVEPGMPLFDEESFGPVAALIKVNDVEDAIEKSNQSDFGLGVSVITSHPQEILARSIDFKDGALFVNSIVKSDPRLPFGGTGISGYGRELAKEGIRHFTNQKTVYVGS